MSSMLLRSAVGVDADADRKYGPAWRRLVCLPDRGRVEGDGAAPNILAGEEGRSTTRFLGRGLVCQKLRRRICRFLMIRAVASSFAP